MGRFLSLFVLVPLLELILLIQVGRWIGLWPTLAAILLTGVLGAALVRAEGVRVLNELQRELAGGRIPAQPLLAGAALLVGGAFLLTPGVLTDLVGFALLLPPSRGVLLRFVKHRFEKALARGTIRMHVAGAPGGFGFTSAPGEGDDGDPTSHSPPSRPPRPGEIIQE